jgi:hypothetical protein
MVVKHWLIGCALCFAGIGGAAAASVDGRDLDNVQRGASDNSGAHDASIGDTSGMIHDGNPHSHAGETTKSTAGSNGEHVGGDGAPPTHTQPAHLGWQSLLPGSIQ